MLDAPPLPPRLFFSLSHGRNSMEESQKMEAMSNIEEVIETDLFTIDLPVHSGESISLGYIT